MSEWSHARSPAELSKHTELGGGAESHFFHAIEIARGQRARSLELRAATSLSRLWANQGKATEAHALLAGVYG